MFTHWKIRSLLFLCGSPNIAGSLLALSGLGLFFGGVIADWWLAIVAGLYASGYLIVPEAKGLENALQAEATRENLVEGVSRLACEARPRLPAEAGALLEKIQLAVQELAPSLFNGSMPLEHCAIMTNAITRDLPSTVGNYLRLPTAFANMHVVEDGKTCKVLLVEQLGLLDAQLAMMARSVHMHDVEAVQLNGILLKEKFRPVSFID